MKKLHAIVATALLGFSMTACAATGDATESAASKSAAGGGAAAAISAAKASNKGAKSAGYEWRDTGKMIKKAEKLAGEGKTEAAIKLAKKAEMQGKVAQVQATSQKNAGPRF